MTVRTLEDERGSVTASPWRTGSSRGRNGENGKVGEVVQRRTRESCGKRRDVLGRTLPERSLRACISPIAAFSPLLPPI